MSKKAWFVDYATDTWDHCYIVIHCDERSDVRKVLKKHLGTDSFKINRTTSYDVGYTGWSDEYES